MAAAGGEPLVATMDLVAAFGRAMCGFAPFEEQPHLAVAVSGGADSLALCLLADDWARRQGGRVTALTVDHGLRAGSAAEAVVVGGWLAQRSIAHRVLPWRGEKPTTAIQHCAREARYRLLLACCRQAGIAHLLLGHHRGDQAETVLLRLLRGSGIHGLAGMWGFLQTPDVRLLRPLLDCDPAQLRTFLRGRHQPWIDDPSNADPRFTRNRLRAILASAAAGLPTTEALLSLAADAATARTTMQEAVGAFLAQSCCVFPAGYAGIDRAALLAAPVEVSVRALAAVVTTVGGAAYECSSERVRRARHRLGDGATAATLGRCRMIVRDDMLWVFRDRRRLPVPRPLAPDDDLLWDGRFRVTIAALPHAPAPPGLMLRSFEDADGRIIRLNRDSTKETPVPHLARITLPVLSDAQGLLMAPFVGYTRPGYAIPQSPVAHIAWSPRRSITGAGYFLAYENLSIIS